MPKSKYTHLSQRNQILKRPGQHIGSTKLASRNVYLVETTTINGSETDIIVEKEVEYVPGLLHIFYEVLSNAQDNYFNSKASNTPLKKIQVSVDKESGTVSVWNDGCWIPNKIHEWGADEEVIDNKPHYEAEIIFGHLNSSSNYNDDEKQRIGGGLHGVGVKLTNIFSKKFTVECFDPDTGIRFKQEYSDSMSQAKPPKITHLKQKKGYTKIEYIADFELFGVDGYTDSDLQIIRKMCFDCAMITGQRIIFNDEVVPVKNLTSYAKCYSGGGDENAVIEFKTDQCNVVVCEKPAFEPGLIQVSFVNGISTARGGVHLNAWKKAIFTPLLQKIKIKLSPKGKNSSPIKLTAKNLENYFMIFINCTLPNPEFEGQTKGVLSSPTPYTNVPPGKLTTMMRWGFMDDVKETIRVQGLKELKKTDGKKTMSVNVNGADDANMAGKVKSEKCTLVIVEGLSAKSFVVKGISAIQDGANWYGILPVRGKVLNVRDAGTEQINNNTEITNLKTMLGLRSGVDYTKPENFKTLRYGRVVILTDADHDGDHIKGLLINFFQYFHPSLLTRGFVNSIRTPIVKVTKGARTISFYYLKEFKEWAERQTSNFTAKYYKGLGTSTDAEIVSIFENPKNSKYNMDAQAVENIDMVFNKKRANDRKKWLENYKQHDFEYESDDGMEIVPVTDFINNEFVEFSIYDNKRSIPCVVDGFKPSQRKALWAALKLLNTKKDLKVAQFATDVAKLSQYHHGEVSLQSAIIGMAQSFVGSNNISLFYESGQFGTRLLGGSDCSAARYIFTRLQTITRFIFRKEDDPILNYLEDDGVEIEPQYFVPVIPMLLVNGSKGIGTGYSTHVPSFNPLELVEWIKVWLKKGDYCDENAEEFPELTPWYRGFKGFTQREDANKFLHYGNIEKVGDHYEITELPIGVWTDDYKNLLNVLKNGKPAKETKTGYDAMTIAKLKEELTERGLPMTGTKKVLIERLKNHDKDNGNVVRKAANVGQILTKWENHSDAYNVKFKIWPKSGADLSFENPKLKLTTTDNLTNMTAFTPSDGLKKYANLSEIMNTFCGVRHDFYKKRKKQLIVKINENIKIVQAKIDFVEAVLTNFKLLRQTQEELFDYLDKKGFHKVNNSYSYLVDMPIRYINTPKRCETLLKQLEELKEELEYIEKQTTRRMWTRELQEFADEYKKWVTEMESVQSSLSKKKIKRRNF